jgi:hypothetical protein
MRPLLISETIKSVVRYLWLGAVCWNCLRRYIESANVCFAYSFLGAWQKPCAVAAGLVTVQSWFLNEHITLANTRTKMF